MSAITKLKKWYKLLWLVVILILIIYFSEIIIVIISNLGRLIGTYIRSIYEL